MKIKKELLQAFLDKYGITAAILAETPAEIPGAADTLPEHGAGRARPAIT